MTSPMQVFKVNLSEAPYRLGGGLIGRELPSEGLPLVGKAITFTNPSFTHTFIAGSGVDPTMLNILDIKTQLELASGGDLVVKQISTNRIVFVEAVMTSAVQLSADVEAAKTMLGFAPSSRGFIAWPPGSGLSPQVVAISQAIDDSMLTVVLADAPLLLGAAVSYSASTAAAGTGVLLAAAGKLWSITATNISTNDRWFQLFDKATAPGAGNTPIIQFACAPGATVNMNWPSGIPVSNGLSWGSSTSPTAYAASGTSDFWVLAGVSS